MLEIGEAAQIAQTLTYSFSDVCVVADKEPLHVIARGHDRMPPRMPCRHTQRVRMKHCYVHMRWHKESGAFYLRCPNEDEGRGKYYSLIDYCGHPSCNRVLDMQQ